MAIYRLAEPNDDPLDFAGDDINELWLKIIPRSFPELVIPWAERLVAEPDPRPRSWAGNGIANVALQDFDKAEVLFKQLITDEDDKVADMTAEACDDDIYRKPELIARFGEDRVEQLHQFAEPILRQRGLWS